jgi:hypothetical protein
MGVEWSGLFAQQYVEMCPADMAPGTLPTFCTTPGHFRCCPMTSYQLLHADFPPETNHPRSSPRDAACSVTLRPFLGFSGAVRRRNGVRHIPGAWPRDYWPRTGHVLHSGHAPLPTRRAQRPGWHSLSRPLDSRPRHRGRHIIARRRHA